MSDGLIAVFVVAAIPGVAIRDQVLRDPAPMARRRPLRVERIVNGLLGELTLGQFGWALVLLSALAIMAYTVYRRRNPPARRWWARPSSDRMVTSDDTSGLGSVGFELFARGRDRRLENVSVAAWNDLSVRLFEFVCNEDEDSLPGFEDEVRFVGATTAVPMSLAPMTVARENLATTAADQVALDDIALEPEHFNRAFDVRCADRRFASAFLDQRIDPVPVGVGPHPHVRDAGAMAARLQP